MRTFLGLFLLMLAPMLAAEDIHMVRCKLPFPEAMTVLQETIRENGYQVSRVQRVDIGLTTFGYQTDKYRVVFFGKLDEVRHISAEHVSLIPYVPLKIAIFAEGEETLLLASSFSHLRRLYTEPELQDDFDRWEADTRRILDTVRVAE